MVKYDHGSEVNWATGSYSTGQKISITKLPTSSWWLIAEQRLHRQLRYVPHPPHNVPLNCVSHCCNISWNIPTPHWLCVLLWQPLVTQDLEWCTKPKRRYSPPWCAGADSCNLGCVWIPKLPSEQSALKCVEIAHNIITLPLHGAYQTSWTISKYHTGIDNVPCKVWNPLITLICWLFCKYHALHDNIINSLGNGVAPSHAPA